MFATKIWLVSYKQSDVKKAESYVDYEEALTFAQGLNSHTGYSEVELKEIELISKNKINLDRSNEHHIAYASEFDHEWHCPECGSVVYGEYCCKCGTHLEYDDDEKIEETEKVTKFVVIVDHSVFSYTADGDGYENKLASLANDNYCYVGHDYDPVTDTNYDIYRTEQRDRVKSSQGITIKVNAETTEFIKKMKEAKRVVEELNGILTPLAIKLLSDVSKNSEDGENKKESE